MIFTMAAPISAVKKVATTTCTANARKATLLLNQVSRHRGQK
jgi:hypothetical protein